MQVPSINASSKISQISTGDDARASTDVKFVGSRCVHPRLGPVSGPQRPKTSLAVGAKVKWDEGALPWIDRIPGVFRFSKIHTQMQGESFQGSKLGIGGQTDWQET